MRIALLLFALTVPALAQTTPCVGLTSVTDTALPVYPPIAKAARVQGDVTLLVTFGISGKVEKTEIVSGPPMLSTSATDYVNGWRANSYTSTRTCTVVVRYQVTTIGCDESPGNDSLVRTDTRHISLKADVMPLCDPAVVIKKHKRFLWIF